MGVKSLSPSRHQLSMSYPYLSDLLQHAFGISLSLPIPMFGLLVGLAFFVSLKLADVEVKRLMPDQPVNLMNNAGFIGFFSGLIGARLFHLLEYPREFLAQPMAMLLDRGGFTIFGGLIVGVLVGLIYARAKRTPLPTLLDACAPALMLGYAIGRIGCQISGDGDWGITADLAAKPDWLPTWLWAQTYEGNIAGVLIAPPGVYPTPIYETLMSLVAFTILWSLRKHRHRAGWLFGVYLLLVGVERLWIEPLRVNTTYSVQGMSFTQAQIIAALCVAAGAATLVWRGRAARNERRPQ